jgi:L-asparaginase
LIRELSGEPDPIIAIDGCGIPTYGLTLAAMARAYANLTCSGTSWERIPRVMGAHPDLIGSQDWIDVRLMEVTQGRLIAKTGAEGLLCVGVPGRGLGAAIKVLDGSTRALGAATIAWLLRREWLTEEEAADERLAELRRPIFTDPAGAETGEICVTDEGSR